MDDSKKSRLELYADLALCVVLFTIAIFCVDLSKDIRRIEKELDKLQQQEEVEESTITCPRCFKEFELSEQPPEYKKPRQRTPAPCGTIK